MAATDANTIEIKITADDSELRSKVTGAAESVEEMGGASEESSRKVETIEKAFAHVSTHLAAHAAGMARMARSIARVGEEALGLSTFLAVMIPLAALVIGIEVFEKLREAAVKAKEAAADYAIETSKLNDKLTEEDEKLTALIEGPMAAAIEKEKALGGETNELGETLKKMEKSLAENTHWWDRWITGIEKATAAAGRFAFPEGMGKGGFFGMPEGEGEGGGIRSKPFIMSNTDVLERVQAIRELYVANNQYQEGLMALAELQKDVEAGAGPAWQGQYKAITEAMNQIEIQQDIFNRKQTTAKIEALKATQKNAVDEADVLKEQITRNKNYWDTLITAAEAGNKALEEANKARIEAIQGGDIDVRASITAVEEKKTADLSAAEDTRKSEQSLLDVKKSVLQQETEASIKAAKDQAAAREATVKDESYEVRAKKILDIETDLSTKLTAIDKERTDKLKTLQEQELSSQQAFEARKTEIVKTSTELRTVVETTLKKEGKPLGGETSGGTTTPGFASIEDIEAKKAADLTANEEILASDQHVLAVRKSSLQEEAAAAIAAINQEAEARKKLFAGDAPEVRAKKTEQLETDTANRITTVNRELTERLDALEIEKVTNVQTAEAHKTEIIKAAADLTTLVMSKSTQEGYKIETDKEATEKTVFDIDRVMHAQLEANTQEAAAARSLANLKIAAAKDEADEQIKIATEEAAKKKAALAGDDREKIGKETEKITKETAAKVETIESTLQKDVRKLQEESVREQETYERKKVDIVTKGAKDRKEIEGKTDESIQAERERMFNQEVETYQKAFSEEESEQRKNMENQLQIIKEAQKRREEMVSAFPKMETSASTDVVYEKAIRDVEILVQKQQEYVKLLEQAKAAAVAMGDVKLVEKQDQQLQKARADIQRLIELEQEYVTKMKEADDEIVKHNQDALDKMTSSWNTALDSWIRGTESFQKAMTKAWQEMVMSVINALIKMTEQQLAQSLGFQVMQAKNTTVVVVSQGAQTTAVVAGQAQQTAAVQGAQAAQTTAIVAAKSVQAGVGAGGGIAQDIALIKNIFAMAGQAAAKVFNQVINTVPFPANVVLAPAAAAGVFAAVAAYATLAGGGGGGAGGGGGGDILGGGGGGGDSGGGSSGEGFGGGFAARGAIVPEDMPIFAHAREMILPEHIATPLQEAIPSLSGFRSAASGGFKLNIPTPVTGAAFSSIGKSTTSSKSVTNNIRPTINITHAGTQLSDGDIQKAVSRGIRTGALSFED